MAELGKQLKSVMSSIRVADRITNLIRSDERAKTQARTDVYRVAVAIAPPSVSGGEQSPIGRDFKLSLVEKKTSDHVHVVIRAWPIIKQIVLFIRGVVPKLDVPPLPVEAAGSAPALVAEDRRKYIQTYVNAALQNPGVANLKEFQDLIGFGEYTSLHAHDAPSLNANASLPRISLDSNASFSSLGKTQSSDHATSAPSPAASSPQGAPRKSVAAPSVPSTVEQGTSASSLHRMLEECFRVMDVGGAGYLTPEDMKVFLDIMVEQTAKSKPIVGRITKEANAVAATDFATMILKAAQECVASGASPNVAVEKWINEYRSTVFTEVYAALGDVGSASQQQQHAGGDDEHRSYDLAELRTLQFVLRVSGIRIVTEAEVSREEGLSLPVTVDDFCRLMFLVTAVIPFDDVVRALEISPRGDHHAKLLHLVNKHASSAVGAKKQALRDLQDAIAELGGGARRLGKCGNCEASEQRIRALKLQLTEMEDENAGWKRRVAELEDQLAVKTHAFADAASQATTIVALEQEIASLRDAQLEWEGKVGVLEDRVKELESLDTPPVAAEAAPIAVYEVHPTSVSGTAPSLVDLPGTLTIPVDSRGRPAPNVLQMDVYYTGSTGVEYIACRDRDGSRLLGLRLDNGVVHCLNGVVQSLSLPTERWVRLTIEFVFTKRCFHLKVNGLRVWASIPLKDHPSHDEYGRECDTLDLIDIYPRHEVLYCYSNIQFLVI